MNTKISDARKLACETGMYYSQNEKCQPGVPFYAFTVGELERFAEKVAGLAADAVPVAVAAGISQFGVLECNLLPGGLEQLQASGGEAKLYLHPQPAALNEISGNSGELGGDERARFEAWARSNGYSLVRSEDDYYLTSTQTAWTAWQAALTATGKQPLQVGEAQGVNLSPIATRKLGELAAQGYVTNGVAIFNPATGQRGLVDNLGFVGWMGAQGIDLGQFSEPVHYWLHAIAGYVNASGVFGPATRAAYASKVAEAKRLLALIDSQRNATTLANITPPRDLRTQLHPGDE